MEVALPWSAADSSRDHDFTCKVKCLHVLQAAFRREVSETFLRCVDMGYDQDLAVIELNGLKIAEARDFADNASYIMTTILSLCLPPAPRVREEYRALFPDTSPDSKTAASDPSYSKPAISFHIMYTLLLLTCACCARDSMEKRSMMSLWISGNAGSGVDEQHMCAGRQAGA